VLEELSVDVVWTCGTTILECGDGGLNLLLCYMGLEGPLGALKQLTRFVLLVSKLLLEPVFDGSCLAFVRSHKVTIGCHGQ